MSVDIAKLNDRIREESSFVTLLKGEVGKVIVGQSRMIDRLLIGLLCRGHILLEGVPGLAKTLAVATLAKAIDTGFRRLQFTPDLLPADLVGTLVYNQKTGDFVPKKGPLFSNIILADEINRAPAKVQSALLEAMQERQVTIGDATYPLEEPFLVLATQNPIEQEGTYPLPEAQVDRFMLKLKVVYPTREEEKQILERMAGGEVPPVQRVISVDKILSARSVVNEIYMDPKVEDYIVNIVFASREPASVGLTDVKDLIAWGASPRATLNLTRAARAHAFIRGRGYVTPEDVKSIGMDVLRHRIIVTYEAEAENITPEDIVQKIFDRVEVP
ncbi:MAG: MoxR family ATPase [Chitinispirillaceae bacterium]|jgi:MoxR-like ATPase